MTLKDKEKSLLDIAREILALREGPQDIKDIAKEAMEIKGLKNPEGRAILPQFLADFMESGYFVYCGNQKWDLKEDQPTSILDKDAGYEVIEDKEATANEMGKEIEIDREDDSSRADDEDDENDEDKLDDDEQEFIFANVDAGDGDGNGFGDDTELNFEENEGDDI